MKLVKTLVAALALATIASTAMFAAPKQEGNIKKIKPKKTVTLDVYSQLANYSGLQTGWFADVMLEKFNVKINIYFEKLPKIIIFITFNKSTFFYCALSRYACTVHISYCIF